MQFEKGNDEMNAATSKKEKDMKNLILYSAIAFIGGPFLLVHTIVCTKLINTYIIDKII